MIFFKRCLNFCIMNDLGEESVMNRTDEAVIIQGTVCVTNGRKGKGTIKN